MFARTTGGPTIIAFTAEGADGEERLIKAIRGRPYFPLAAAEGTDLEEWAEEQAQAIARAGKVIVRKRRFRIEDGEIAAVLSGPVEQSGGGGE